MNSVSRGAALLVLIGPVAGAAAQENVLFDAIRSESFPAVSSPIKATFQPGAGDANRKPVVVILHGAGGVDGRGQAYASRLLAAGTAFTKNSRARNADALSQ
ncbi:hypothetical protein [Rubrivivax gelatinosus]|uniref:hypothetical protein n=1 Tax=Rubrivivax gelatinosus TaxID=28068 RepID=UPI0005C151F0|nr:hypothetical protein [Rubrivivax gelatinosus]